MRWRTGTGRNALRGVTDGRPRVRLRTPAREPGRLHPEIDAGESTIRLGRTETKSGDRRPAGARGTDRSDGVLR
ncbi:hypothetical protein GCM10010472_16540 [Pseudonocardia halophobica]|uniref:Uncharacterized protein n=1 Tax=Pseudonocardia halophobica TaxID=29401 RepID=A0A9W6NWH2_9PSEU|nr:hypothetical protein GCM10017577_28090 [Pseudonocardia halophobica]